jgi:hypothetical protein
MRGRRPDKVLADRLSITCVALGRSASPGKEGDQSGGRMEFHGDGHQQAVNILKGKLEANRPGCDSGLMLHDDALIQVTRGGRHTHGTQHLAAARARVSGRRSVLWTPAA